MKRLFLLFFLLSYFHSSSIYIYIGQREKKFSADDKRYIYCKSRARLYVVLCCGAVTCTNGQNGISVV